MNPTVSIIIPVYNAANYLERCVDSVLNQEYTDFELLLMDDGSTDASVGLCDAYAAADSRVRVFHKENSGVSDTRNMGIREARGTYLQFLDSDDWITPDATKLFVRAAQENDCDLVISDFYRVVGERVSQKGDIDEEMLFSREDFAQQMMEDPADFYYGVLWNKLYRRDLIEKYSLRMNTEISWCEDFMFNLEYLRYADSIYALKAPVYYYVKRKGSLVTQGNSISNTIRMKLMVFEYYNNFYNHVFDEEDYEKNRLRVYRFLIDGAGDGMVPPFMLPGTHKLGNERISVCPEAISGDGFLMDAYRNQKLLERYLEVVAIKNHLTLTETLLLLYLNQPHSFQTRKELEQFTNLSRRTLAQALQHLTAKGLLKAEEQRKPSSRGDQDKDTESKTSGDKLLTVTFLPAAEPIVKEILAALDDCDEARFQGFTEEELSQYRKLSQKIKENVRRILL